MDFIRNRAGYLVNDTHRECSSCGRIFKKRKPEFSSHKAWCTTCRANNELKRSVERRMLCRAKGRAKDMDLEFDLVLEDLYIPEVCPILGIPLVRAVGTVSPTSPTLDRKDNSLGYTKDNIWVISNLANSMKNSANAMELRAFARWVRDEYGLD